MRRTRLIAFAADPTFEYVEANVDAMAETGFDGHIFNPTYMNGLILEQYAWNLWSSTLLPIATPLWAALNSPPANNLSHNFLRANITPGTIDWFDFANMDIVKANYVNYAKLANDSYCRGIFWDNEAYDGHPFRYSTQPQAGTFSFDDYKARVKEYAYNLGLEMWAVFPACVFFCAFGYAISIDAAGPDEDKVYGLLPSFLDGLLDSMADFPCVQCIMGNEGSYNCSIAMPCWGFWVDHSKLGVYRGGSAQFARHASIAMATNVTQPPFDNVVTGGNYFTPSGLTDSLVAASAFSDKYLWVYSGIFGWSPPAQTAPPFDLLSTNYSNSILNALPNVV